ncbi:hypothetical protein HMSSN139_10370 [Paenibacillus sp. HMSSN-139]|nr:hypothetical protein HMSSN139_10370 [Paenibacillus sp. HMSSN-139]
MDEPLGWSLGDKSFFKQSLEVMAQEKQPFYSFLITLSSHHPYSLPASVQELDTGEFKGTIFGDYLQAVHYVDAALGEFVEGLKREGLWDHTILAFYGDHDNSITDKAVYEQFLGKTLSDLDMHQILNQVPLLIHLPDGKHASVDSEPAGQLDLTPSLLHLLGIATDSYYLMGNNLFAATGSDRAADRLVVLRSGAFYGRRAVLHPVRRQPVRQRHLLRFGQPQARRDRAVPCAARGSEEAPADLGRTHRFRFDCGLPQGGSRSGAVRTRAGCGIAVK